MSGRLILVGRVAGAFGVRGEVKITSYTDDPVALVRYRDMLREDGSPALTLSGGRPQKGQLVARAREVADRDQAEALIGDVVKEIVAISITRKPLASIRYVTPSFERLFVKYFF